MTGIEWLMLGGLVGFAVFFFAVGYALGSRRATRRHLPALVYAAKKPTPADLGNTVARQPQRPPRE